MLGILLIIFLVIILGRPEFHRRENFRGDRLVKFSRAGELGFGGFGDFLLILVGVENRGAVARADVGELSIGLRGIDLFPVNVQQLVIGDFCWIINDLD